MSDSNIPFSFIKKEIDAALEACPPHLKVSVEIGENGMKISFVPKED